MLVKVGGEGVLKKGGDERIVGILAFYNNLHFFILVGPHGLLLLLLFFIEFC
jgi:hypothetical protein